MQVLLSNNLPWLVSGYDKHWPIKFKIFYSRQNSKLKRGIFGPLIFKIFLEDYILSLIVFYAVTIYFFLICDKLLFIVSNKIIWFN